MDWVCCGDSDGRRIENSRVPEWAGISACRNHFHLSKQSGSFNTLHQLPPTLLGLGLFHLQPLLSQLEDQHTRLMGKHVAVLCYFGAGVFPQAPGGGSVVHDNP